MKYVSKLFVLVAVFGLTSSVALAAAKKTKKKAPPVAAEPAPTPAPAVEQPAPSPAVDTAKDSAATSSSDSSSMSAAGTNLISLGLAYIKPLGMVKDYASKGLQYSLEWRHNLPSAPGEWRPHTGLIFSRAKLKGDLDSGSTATNTRTDYLVDYGWSCGESANGLGFFGDGLLGLVDRRLYIQSGNSAIGDDYFQKVTLGFGFRGGLEMPFKAGDSQLVTRLGLGLLTGMKATSGRLHYNQDTVDVNGTHLTLGADLGWLF